MQCLDRTAGQSAKLYIPSAIKNQNIFFTFCFSSLVLEQLTVDLLMLFEQLFLFYSVFPCPMNCHISRFPTSTAQWSGDL